MYTQIKDGSFIICNGNYEWSVQAIDANFVGGPFATVKTFTISTTGINDLNSFKPTVYALDRNLYVKS